MIKISRATKEQAMRYADFFRPEVSGGGGFEDNILYLGYDDDTLEVVCAASVYPALEGAHLTGICVAKERQRQGIGRQLINTIAEDLGLVYAVNEGSLPRIIVEESMDRDMVICLDPFLVKCGFSEKKREQLMYSRLKDMSSGAGKGTDEKIIPLKSVPGKALRAFGNKLIDKKLFPGIDTASLDPDISMFYLADEQVKGCLLMSRTDDDELMNEWLYLGMGVRDRTVIEQMIAAAVKAALALLPADTRVWFIPVNEAGEKIVDTYIPSAAVGAELRTYERIL